MYRGLKDQPQLKFLGREERKIMLAKRSVYIVFILWIIFVSCSLPEQSIENGESQLSPREVSNIPIEATPEFIGELWPEPGNHLSLFDYQTYRRYAATQSGICVDFGGAFLFFEEGDFLTHEQLFKRFSLQIDNQIIAEPDYVLMRDTEKFDGPIDPNTGELIYSIPEGYPYFLCFYADLKAGYHTATFIAQKTSGDELSYSWSFTLVED